MVSHAIAWAAITHPLNKGFLRPPTKNVALQFHASVFLRITGNWVIHHILQNYEKVND